MNKWHVLLALLLVALGWFLRTVTLTPQIREVPVTVRVPVVQNVSIPVKVETVSVVRWRETFELSDWDSLPANQVDRVQSFRAQLDTLLPYLVEIHQGDSVIQKDGLVNAYLDASCLPSERAFILSTLRLEPLNIRIPYRETTLTPGRNTLDLWAISGTRLSAGLGVAYNRLYLGWDYHPFDKAGELRVGYRVFGF